MNDEAARLAEDSFHAFLTAMAAAGNPGSDRHEIGIHKVHGWILEYDPTIGGAQIQAVIGTDGHIHGRRTPRSERVRKLTAAEWVLRDPENPEPMTRATAFAEHLSRILAFDGAGGEWPAPPPA